MYGYIFISENLKSGKKFLGKFASVNFNRTYFGDNPKLLADVEKLGKENFTVKMIRACESQPEYEMAYDMYLNEYKALTDDSFYNCEKAVKTESEEPEEKSKKSRKKKVVEE